MKSDRRNLLRLLITLGAVAVVGGLLATVDRPSGHGTDVRSTGALAEPSTATTDTTSSRTAAEETTTTTTTHVEETAPATTTTTAGTTSEPVKWSAESDSLKASVEVSASSLRVADVVRFIVTVEDESGSTLRVGIDYGDRTPTGVPAPTHLDCQSESDPASSERRVAKQVVFSHGYRQVGSVTPRIVVRSNGCQRAERSLEITGNLDVLAISGVIPTNGPLGPAVTAEQPRTASTTGTVTLIVTATDLDGYVRTIEVDWGDGSTPSVQRFGLDDCTDDPGFWAPSQRTVTFEHEFRESGDHGVVARVTSSGCTGSDAQQGEERLVLTSS